MAVGYKVEADVIDINQDAPKQNERFLVDTNVWFWMHYTRASQVNQPPRLYQIRDYPNYMRKALKAKAQLFRCELSLSELAHLIEKTEWEIYTSANGYVDMKAYRHNNVAARANVITEIEDAWEAITRMSVSMSILVDEQEGIKALNRMRLQPIGGYDLFLVDAAINQGINQIITDDGDFSTVPGIQMFTANKNVINSAKRQGKLRNR